MSYKQALQHAQHFEPEVEFLGEGAWHRAWKLTRKEQVPLVLRIPKKVAYKKEVTYDAAFLKAEYGGTDLYYRCVNRAQPGAAPTDFTYHVSEGITYTIESFAGRHVDLHRLTEEKAQQLGEGIGQLYQKIEKVDHGIKGFGFFAWNEEQGLHGQISSDYASYIKEECTEVMADYEELSTKNPIFKELGLEETLKRICNTRLEEISQPVLTNQDASPENWLLDHGEIRLIDPLPLLYFGEVMAGNFMNLYETLFVELANTERYGKHRFHECQGILQAIANGFAEGYCAGDPHKIRVLRGEQLLQVLDSAVRHMQMLESGLNEEQIIRFGSKEDVEKRLVVFAWKIKELTQLV